MPYQYHLTPAIAGASMRAQPTFSQADGGNPWSGGLKAAELALPGLDGNDASGFAEGLLKGTMVATGNGWRPVDELQPGDRVITFDNGLQPVRAIRQAMLWTSPTGAPEGEWPLSVPGHVLGNRTEMLLMPGQRVLFEADEAEALYGDAFILLAARAFDGWRGIARVAPPRQLMLIALEFDDEQLVYTNGTLLAHCGGQEGQGAHLLAMDGALHDDAQSGGRYRHLTAMQGRDLIAQIHAR